MKLNIKGQKKGKKPKKRQVASFVNKRVDRVRKYKQEQTDAFNKQKAYFASEDTDENRLNNQYERDQEFLKSLFNVKVISLFIVLILLYLLIRRY